MEYPCEPTEYVIIESNNTNIANLQQTQCKLEDFLLSWQALLLSLGGIAVFVSMIIIMCVQMLLAQVFPWVNASWSMLDQMIMNFRQFVPNIISVGKVGYSVLVCLTVVVETSVMGFMNGKCL